MSDSTFANVSSNRNDLADFFKRPVLLTEFTWAVGSDIWEEFNPWAQFFSNPKVINRINNYYHLRARLHVRFLINGNSFYHNDAIVFYTPKVIHDNFYFSTAATTIDLVRHSQKPHIFLDPTMSQGGDFILPFFHDFNALSIPDAEWNDMGILTLQSFAPLAHVNSPTGNVIISVFGWLEEVDLSIPTGVNSSAIVPQAGPSNEYSDSPVSRPAFALAAMAGRLQNIPYIAPYALATQVAANAVGTVAKIFGYSRPPNVDDQMSMQMHPYGTVSITNAKEITEKLTLDIKSELTIDTRTMGLDGKDEMALSYITSMESYLSQASWSTADIPGKVIWQSVVNPIQLDADWNTAAGPDRILHYTALGIASSCFARWRGGIKFRFKIMASAFHKGRIRISYDPISDAVPAYNVSFNRVIDLATDRDFTIVVPYANVRSWLDLRRTLRDRRPYRNNAFDLPIAPQILDTDNGYLTVTVLNQLTTASATASAIRIVVFVSGAEDFELCEPTSTVTADFSPYLPQSGSSSEYKTTDPVHCDMDIPVDPVSYMMFDNTIDERDSAIFFADPVKSFRQLFKRYDLLRIIPLPVNFYGYITGTSPNFPVTRGAYPGGTKVINRGVTINVIGLCYAAWRGTLRYKYIYGSQSNPDDIYMVGRSIRTTNIQQGFLATTVPSLGADDDTRRVVSMANRPDTFRGNTLAYRRANNAITVDIPYYDNRRFEHMRINPFIAAVPTHQLYARHRVDNVTRSEVEVYVATGEDFQLAFWIGPPRYVVLSDLQILSL